MARFIRYSVKHTYILLKILGITFALFFKSSLLHAEGSALVLQINNTNNPPYSTPEQTGYVDLIAKEAFQRIGVTLQLVVLPPERGLLSANEGSIDGDLTRIAGLDKKYPNLIRVPEKIMDWEFIAFSKNATETAKEDLIRNHPVAHIKGWKIYEDYLAGANFITTVTQPEQLFNLIEKDRVQHILYERWLGMAMLRKLQINDIHPIKPMLAKREMYVYLNKRHAHLVKKLAQTLRQLKQEGFYNKVYQQTLQPYAQVK